MLSYIDVIPAMESVSRAGSLNLLGGVANDGGAITLDITVWGRVDRDWVALATKKTKIGAREHKHLYFTLGPDCFSPERWGDEIEDLELKIDHQRPADDARGIIVFIDQGGASA